jgi:hypothetical protein
VNTIVAISVSTARSKTVRLNALPPSVPIYWG